MVHVQFHKKAFIGGRAFMPGTIEAVHEHEARRFMEHNAASPVPTGYRPPADGTGPFPVELDEEGTAADDGLLAAVDPRLRARKAVAKK